MEMVMMAKNDELDAVNAKLKEGWTVKECRPVPGYNYYSGMGDTKIFVYFVLEKKD